MLKVNFGSGKKKLAGFINIDYSPEFHPDILLDLNITPYPFANESVDYVLLDNVLEHLNDPLKTVNEVYRICKINAVCIIKVPYFRSIWAFTDLTHKKYFAYNSFSYFDPKSEYFIKYKYSNSTFEITNILFNHQIKSGIIKKIIAAFANKFPNYYEYYLSHIYPLDSLTFCLKKI